MGVNMDLINPPAFMRGGGVAPNSVQARIRQQANTAKAKGVNQIHAFKRLTAEGGPMPQSAEVTAAAPTALTAQKLAGEVLRTHRKLIDNLVDHIMFG